MATTAAELLELARAEARRHRAPTVAQAEAAITALGHAGRCLRQLTPRDPAALPAGEWAGVEHAARTYQQACDGWAARSGRLPDLVGAACDLLAAHTPGSPEQRWAVAVAINRAARHCLDLAARYEPYARIPTLSLARDAAVNVERGAARRPPALGSAMLLDLPIPAPHPTRREPLAAVLDGIAAVRQALHDERAAGPLPILAALATATVAEHTARHCVTQLAEPDDAGAWRQAPAAWQVLQAALIRFQDGSRRPGSHPSPTVHAARQLHHALARAMPAADHTRPGELAALGVIADQLPLLARQLGLAARGWTRSRVLFARARNLIPTDELVSAILHNAAVPAGPEQLVPVAAAIHVAERLSGALADELDRATPNACRQPGKHPAGFAARSSTLTRDADWAARLAARAPMYSPVADRRV